MKKVTSYKIHTLVELNNTTEDCFVHFIELNIEICLDGSGSLQ